MRVVCPRPILAVPHAISSVTLRRAGLLAFLAWTTLGRHHPHGQGRSRAACSCKAGKWGCSHLSCPPPGVCSLVRATCPGLARGLPWECRQRESGRRRHQGEGRVRAKTTPAEPGGAGAGPPFVPRRALTARFALGAAWRGSALQTAHRVPARRAPQRFVNRMALRPAWCARYAHRLVHRVKGCRACRPSGSVAPS